MKYNKNAKKDLYVCKNKKCPVHTFYSHKGLYSAECPLCYHDDIKKGNNTQQITTKNNQ